MLDSLPPQFRFQHTLQWLLRKYVGGKSVDSCVADTMLPTEEPAGPRYVSLTKSVYVLAAVCPALGINQKPRPL